MMKTPDALYEAAVERMAQSIAMRRADPIIAPWPTGIS